MSVNRDKARQILRMVREKQWHDITATELRDAIMVEFGGSPGLAQKLMNEYSHHKSSSLSRCGILRDIIRLNVQIEETNKRRATPLEDVSEEDLIAQAAVLFDRHTQVSKDQTLSNLSRETGWLGGIEGANGPAADPAVGGTV